MRTQSSTDIPTLEATLYQEGEYWTFVYADRVCRVRNAKGLPCLAYLLRHPGENFAAVDLLAINETPGTLQPSVSAAATLEAANAGPADPEAARVLVTKRIRAVEKKLLLHHPSLAHHLGTCIKTGAHCAYLPDPERPIVWTTRRAIDDIHNVKGSFTP
jgi:hypothetical protein